MFLILIYVGSMYSSYCNLNLRLLCPPRLNIWLILTRNKNIQFICCCPLILITWLNFSIDAESESGSESSSQQYGATSANPSQNTADDIPPIAGSLWKPGACIPDIRECMAEKEFNIRVAKEKQMVRTLCPKHGYLNWAKGWRALLWSKHLNILF